MIPPKRHRPEENVDNWLMSYADMITLLLAFFVIFIAISEPKTEKMEAITESMSGQFGTIDLSTPFQGTYKTLLAVAEEEQLLKDLAIVRTQNGIEMELASSGFFKPGSVELDPERAVALNQMVVAITSIDFMDYRIIIEGHTSDEPPPASTPYPSNWEFSSAQAARVGRYFIEKGIKPEHIKIVGYADTKPQVPNRDLQGNPIAKNQELNARLVIRIERGV